MIVVHPKDPSTAMLQSIYEELDITFFDSYKQKEEILSAIRNAPKDEPILLLGHGCPSGLLDMRYGLLIDEDDAEILKDRPNLVCIWCYASSYAYLHNLKGFFSGMFISEPSEAYVHDVKATDDEVDWCASDFALRFGDMLREGKTIREAAASLMDPKWIVSDLTRYNYIRLEYRETGEEGLPYDDRLAFGMIDEEKELSLKDIK